MGKLEELLRRRETAAGVGATSTGLEYEDDAVAIYPTLYGLIAQTRFENKPRQTATLIVFAEGGKLKYSLNDREAGYVGFGSLDSLEGALEAIEEQLATDKTDWRPQKRNPR